MERTPPSQPTSALFARTRARMVRYTPNILTHWGYYDANLGAAARPACAGRAELSGGAGHRHSAVLSPVLSAPGAADPVVPVGVEQPARAERAARNVHAPHAGGRAGARA